MSAIATEDGANVAGPDGQPAMPPTSTTMKKTIDAAKIRARRTPVRAGGMLAATDPLDIALRAYQHFTCNTVHPLNRKIASRSHFDPKSTALAGTRSSAPWIDAMVMWRGRRIGRK